MTSPALASVSRQPKAVSADANPRVHLAGRSLRLWLPLTALFALLAPFALLLAPLGYLIRPRLRVDPLAAAVALGRVLLSLGGTEIKVETPRFRVRIRVF